MAKYECTITGDFDSVLRRLHDGVMNGSASASYEDGSETTAAGTSAAPSGCTSGTAGPAATGSA